MREAKTIKIKLFLLPTLDARVSLSGVSLFIITDLRPETQENSIPMTSMCVQHLWLGVTLQNIVAQTFNKT